MVAPEPKGIGRQGRPAHERQRERRLQGRQAARERPAPPSWTGQTVSGPASGSPKRPSTRSCARSTPSSSGERPPLHPHRQRGRSRRPGALGARPRRPRRRPRGLARPGLLGPHRRRRRAAVPGGRGHPGRPALRAALPRPRGGHGPGRRHRLPTRRVPPPAGASATPPGAPRRRRGGAQPRRHGRHRRPPRGPADRRGRRGLVRPGPARPAAVLPRPRGGRLPLRRPRRRPRPPPPAPPTPGFRRAGRLPGFGDDPQGYTGKLRAVDFGADGRFDLLECRGSRVLWHRNTGTPGRPSFAPPRPLHAGGQPFDLGARSQMVCPVRLGDGRVSLLVGTNDWSDYWPADVGAWEDQPGYRPYDAHGTWRGRAHVRAACTCCATPAPRTSPREPPTRLRRRFGWARLRRACGAVPRGRHPS